MSKVLVTSYDVGLNQRFKQPKWLSVNIDLRTDPPLNLFAWSQDNSKLSFTAGNTLFISNLSESTTKALTQIVYAQSNVLQVTDFGSIRKILVSPDGLRIAYTDQFAHIWVIDADGKNNSYISTGILLGWSQDSNRLMVFAEGGVAASTRTVTSHNMINGEVGVLSLPNCATRLLQYPVLSPQNNRIAYVSNNRDIWVVNIDGSNAYRLEMGNWSTPNAGYTTNIFWSPDGRYVATRVVDSNDQDNIEKYHKADSVRFVAVFDTIGNSPCIAATGQWLSLRQWI
jgi:dipeptidyl aminopeptidase/acylaminoacyl peptidase